MSVMSLSYSIILDLGISAPRYGKEVVYGLNAVDKRYIYQLMSTVQLPGSNRFDSQMQMHTGTPKYDGSLSTEFQNYLTKEHRKNIVFDQGKHKKRFMKIKWIDRHYNVQDNADVSHKDVRMY